MDVSDSTRPAQTPSTGAQTDPYDGGCEQCGAPVDETQRYCVVCGAHRRHVNDPAARYLASATNRTRVAAATPRPRSTATKRSHGLGTALVLAVIPLAVGLGVLVGRASNNGDDKLIAALRAQKPEIVTNGGGSSAPAAAAAPAATTSTATTSTVSTLTSTFPLQSGYSVELQTLPAHGTDSATVTTSEHAAEANGATDVGLIVPGDFKVTPAPPAGAYVIYAGAYGSRSGAEGALSRLRQKFPQAEVIQVQSAGASTSPTANVNKAPVLSSTLVLSRYATAGKTVSTTYNAYSVLRSTEDLLGYTPLVHASSAQSFVTSVLPGASS